MKKIELFKVEGDKINRIRRHCPKCGPAVFLAEHINRVSCGKCGYTEFKGGGKKQPQQSQGLKEETIEKEPEIEKKSSDEAAKEETSEPEKPAEEEQKEVAIEEVSKENEPEKGT